MKHHKWNHLLVRAPPHDLIFWIYSTRKQVPCTMPAILLDPPHNRQRDTGLRHAKTSSDIRVLHFTNPGPWFTLFVASESHENSCDPQNERDSYEFLFSKPVSNHPNCSQKNKKHLHKKSTPPQNKHPHNKKKPSLPAWSKALLPSLSLNSLVCAVLFDGFLTQLLGGDVFVEWPGHVTVTQPFVLYVPWVPRVTWDNSCNLTLFQNHKCILISSYPIIIAHIPDI